MSPVPLIELQRRLSLVGAIRAGGEKQPNRPGAKLETWRITSPRKQLVEQAAELYGGTVTPWQSPVGPEYQLYTETSELPVLLMPHFSLRQTYELWEGATKRMRLCDGVEEELTGGPCICNAEGNDRCDLYTRLVIALPELDTLLGWRVITRGANAAHELPMMIDAARATTSAPFVPARLHLEQRRGVDQATGQVRRFVVPTLDLGVGYAALAAGAHDPSRPALALVEASTSERPDAAAITPAPGSPSPLPRRAAAFGPESIEPETASAPEVPADNGATTHTAQTFLASVDQKKKLDVLVGKLREAGHITTDGIYDAIGTKLREKAGLDLVAETPDWVDAHGVTHTAIDHDGVTHWAPLRETLTRVEAHQLIEWLVKVEQREAAKAPSSDVEKEEDAPEPEQETVLRQDPAAIYNQFPPGY